MVVFGVKSCIVFVISWDIAFPHVYYLELPDSQKVMTKKTSDFEKKNVRVVIVDLETIVGIQYLENLDYKDNVTHLIVSIIHYDGTSTEEHLCPNDGAFSYCDKVGRFVKVKYEGETMPSFSPNYFSIYLNHFVGCFKAQQSMVTEDKITSIDDCRNFCFEKDRGFYGLNAVGTCACAKFLSQLELVDLNLCNNFIDGFEMHGGDGVFSVYSGAFTNMSSGIVSPSPECVFDQENCTKCPEGRKGMSCEIIDCSINNGGCGDRKCQSFQPKDPKWLFFHAGFCECEHGYYAGLPYCIVPFDECANGSDLCDEITTKCVDKILLYTCECKLFFQELEQYKCQVDIVLIVISCAAAASMLFCSIYVCWQKKKQSKN